MNLVKPCFPSWQSVDGPKQLSSLVPTDARLAQSAQGVSDLLG